MHETTRPSDEFTAASSDSPRILVVDDEKVIREILADFLAMEGYVVRTAEDGTSALAELVARHYDLVISDLEDAEDGRHRAARGDRRTRARTRSR